MKSVSDPFGELPEGFAMALAQDPSALATFGQLSGVERAYFVRRAHRAGSREEMRSLLRKLGGK